MENKSEMVTICWRSFNIHYIRAEFYYYFVIYAMDVEQQDIRVFGVEKHFLLQKF